MTSHDFNKRAYEAEYTRILFKETFKREDFFYSGRIKGSPIDVEHDMRISVTQNGSYTFPNPAGNPTTIFEDRLRQFYSITFEPWQERD